MSDEAMTLDETFRKAEPTLEHLLGQYLELHEEEFVLIEE